MTIRILRDSESLNAIWEELVFTEARLQGDSQAQEFAPSISDLLARLEQVKNGQLGVWREEVAAQAAVDTFDDQLDDWVRALDSALLRVVGENAKAPRYRRYFPVAPSSIIRMGPENELTRVRSWADSLATEPEGDLQELGAQLKNLIVQGDAALERRRNSATACADHRVREITTLVDDINAARLSLFGVLTKKAADLRLSHDWANRFFRHATRSPKVAPQPTPSAK